MLYLSSFSFPTQEEEEIYLDRIKLTCYDTCYPFEILSRKNIEHITFEPFTILYGGNGCGKTTILNIIAEKLRLRRESQFNKTDYLEPYLEHCQAETKTPLPGDSRIITSDDVFDHILRIRQTNSEIDSTREKLFQRYEDNRATRFRLNSMEDYEQLKDINLCKKISKSQYIRRNNHDNIRTQSNGENALRYFTGMITQDALYLLDEPENSLSAENQQKLAQFLEDSCRFYNCQFIISTHSPFLLSIKGAKVYDMDDPPFAAKKWTELKNVRLFHEFFLKHAPEF